MSRFFNWMWNLIDPIRSDCSELGRACDEVREMGGQINLSSDNEGLHINVEWKDE